jgi:hypothetical protein
MARKNDTKYAADAAWHRLMVGYDAAATATDVPSLQALKDNAEGLHHESRAEGWGDEESWWFLLVYNDASERLWDRLSK